jgi:glycosyltransferase involved in cell wall biosynthesis
MDKKIKLPHHNGNASQQQLIEVEKILQVAETSGKKLLIHHQEKLPKLAEVLLITSYPPRECGIANYSHDLLKAFRKKFNRSFSTRVCALESGVENFVYPPEVKHTLKTSIAADYEKLATAINSERVIELVLIQHEFGFFKKQELAFLEFLQQIAKPVVMAFHTVLPHPDEELKLKIQHIAKACNEIIVMTNNSAGILTHDYDVKEEKISVIAHGTHLVSHSDKNYLKQKFGLKGRKVLTTFGLLSAGKSIETTIEALPAIVHKFPETLFLVIGKTHPEVVENDGEVYRESLEQKVKQLGLYNHVRFVNKYLSLPELLEYLQLTDIYLFTTNDPLQAVSGTFVYAMSCACPIISTPIPHARELLTHDTGIIIDFRNPTQLSKNVIKLFNNKSLRKHLSVNSLQKIVSTAWENSAIAHAEMFENLSGGKIKLTYNLPEFNLEHLLKMTTTTGIVQFAKLNQPDIESGYTIDDNARAMIASCMHFKLTGDYQDLKNINTYLTFIRQCLQPSGNFLNYMDKYQQFTHQNKTTNLEDSNGRTIWALGYLISLNKILPEETGSEARAILKKTFPYIGTMHSTRAMAFAIKGLYFYHSVYEHLSSLILIKTLSNRLEQMYYHESAKKWEWFEGYLTYANSVLPEAMLYAWLITREPIYKEIAITSLDFLLTQTFDEKGIKVISNQNWLQKGEQPRGFGEQPIDVAYTIMTLSKFYDVFGVIDYQNKMKTAFNWFLGQNHLHQIVYNPCTGGCYDGLEENNVNLNQGAESTVSYLMARLTMEQYVIDEIPAKKEFLRL